MIEGPVACARVAAGDAARAASPPCHRVLLFALESSVTAAGVIDGPVEIVSIKVCGP